MAGGLAERTPVEVHQWPYEFEALLKIHRRRKPKRLLEIGTYDGGTLYNWLRNAPKGGTVVSVDLYETEEHDNRALYDEWTPKGVNLEVIAASSTAPRTKKALLAMEPFDFAFIDGDHSYAVAASDYELCLRLVKKGGIIALHDIVPPPQPVPWMEVDQLWQEIKDGDFRTREIIGTPYQTWGGIGVVYV